MHTRSSRNRAPTGLSVLHERPYRDWTVRVEHRQVGMTLRRDQYHVRIRDERVSHDEYLRGFASPLAAIQAAERRIDFILDIQRPRQPRPHIARRLRARLRHQA